MHSRATFRAEDVGAGGYDAPPFADEHDQALIRRAAQGDAAAFERLASAYDKELLRLLLALTHSPQDALELCQATLLAAYRELPVRPHCSLYVWLHRLAAAHWLSWTKKNPEAASRGWEQRWRELSARERLVFTLKSSQRLALRTIAEIVDESEDAVGRAFVRAVAKLRMATPEAS
jgi:DNA-directed RNA polymerase specialized sigma24 family protein